MNRFLGYLVLCLILSIGAYGKAPTDSLLRELNKAMEKSAAYDSIKLQHIDSIKRSLATAANDTALQFNIYRQ